MVADVIRFVDGGKGAAHRGPPPVDRPYWRQYASTIVSGRIPDVPLAHRLTFSTINSVDVIAVAPPAAAGRTRAARISSNAAINSTDALPIKHPVHHHRPARWHNHRPSVDLPLENTTPVSVS